MASKRQKREQKMEAAQNVYNVADLFKVDGRIFEVRHVNHGCAWLARPGEVLADVRLNEYGYDQQDRLAVRFSMPMSMAEKEAIERFAMSAHEYRKSGAV